METLKDILNFSFEINNKVHLDVKTLLFVAVILLVTNVFLRLVKKIVTKKLEDSDKEKFKSIFSFFKYFIYVVVIVVGLELSGIDVSFLLAGSAALLVGIGLGLQTLFQDIISGVFILIDKSLTVNDIVEVDGKIGKIMEIKLRTTRAMTIDEKVIIIPNHVFLTNSLFNWTQNGNQITEGITVGVAYGSDVQLVRQILIEVAKKHPKVLKSKPPRVLFSDFGDSALIFRLMFTINNGFEHLSIKSDLRFEIDKQFRENKVQIPFPQRDIHIIKS